MSNTNEINQKITAMTAKAKAGSRDMMVQLGWAYRYGRGVKRNDEQADKWFDLAETPTSKLAKKLRLL